MSVGHYERLGYSRVAHILIRMRRKKTYSHRYRSFQCASSAGYQWRRSLVVGTNNE